MDKKQELFKEIRKDGFWSFVLALAKWILELLFGDFLLNLLKGILGGNYMTNVFQWSLENQFLSTILFFIVVFIVLVLFGQLPKFYGKNKLSFIHRNGKINDGLWENYYVWLEIVGDLETEKYAAILKKLELEKDGVIANYLPRASNSSSPRLRITDEKIFVAETKVTDVLISLKDGVGKPLPKGEKFYFEVDLMNGKKLVKTFKGYLVGGYPDLQIKSI